MELGAFLERCRSAAVGPDGPARVLAHVAVHVADAYGVSLGGLGLDLLRFHDGC